MFKILTILTATIVWGNLSYAYSLGEKEIKILKESIISLCKTTTNNHIKISPTDVGNSKTVLLENLVEIDFSGTATFSKIEWAKIEPFLPPKTGSISYAKCVSEITPLFIDKFSKIYEEETDVDM
ncbi:hypothetical protein MNBD_GAMMA23-1785 [hydrothermal vent metagenome]|uniref:Uncharacterized protein n=1 Tax=hydrothermal vent metagenome TaxID=652676 RepID=A0A3B1A4J5_9ZZZZ